MIKQINDRIFKTRLFVLFFIEVKKLHLKISSFLRTYKSDYYLYVITAKPNQFRHSETIHAF